jgi:hypothetical protein
MPDPLKLLNTLKRAGDLCRSTPGLCGKTVDLATADDVLVAGDLHGNIANFQRIMKLADLARNSHRHLVMQELIHGGFRYADGSDKSHQAVDLWAALKCQFPTRVHYLLGNHEMAQWTNRAVAKADVDLNASFLDGVRTAYGMMGMDIYNAYLDLFQTLPLAVRTPNRVFVSHSLPSAKSMATFDPSRLQHPGYVDDDLKPGGTPYGLVWGRDTSPENVAEFLRRVDADFLISGHIACDNGFNVPNDRQVIVDSLGPVASCCLFPARGPVTQAELVKRIVML